MTNSNQINTVTTDSIHQVSQTANETIQQAGTHIITTVDGV